MGLNKEGAHDKDIMESASAGTPLFRGLLCGNFAGFYAECDPAQYFVGMAGWETRARSSLGGTTTSPI